MIVLPVKKETRRHQAGELGLCVTAATAACLWVAFVDWVGLPRADGTAGGSMAAVLAGLSFTAGAMLGVSVFFCWHVIERARLAGSPKTSSVLLISLPCSALFWFVAQAAFSGPRASRMLPPAWGVPLVAGLMTAAFAGVSGVFLWLVGRRRSGTMDRIGVLLGAVSLLGLSAVMEWVNSHYLLRLYPELHRALTWCGWAAAFMGFGLWFLPPAGKRWGFRTWAGPAAVGAAVLSWFVLLTPLRRSHRVRFLLMDRCPSGQQILEMWPSFRASRAGVSRRRWVAAGAGEGVRGMVRLKGRSVILITVDAMRADRMGFYGGKRKLTPWMDRWARGAVRFRRAYCHAPHSSYSLTALLTGWPIRSLVRLGRPMPPTVATLLRQAGYRTWGFCTRGVFYTDAKQLSAYINDNFGFERFDPHGYDAAKVTDLALQVLRMHDHAKAPFFMWVHYFDVHEPYRRHPGLDFGSRPSDRYDSEIAHVDRHVGRLLSAAARLEPDPVIILTADHGEEFGEHGGYYHGSSLYDEQARVPLIVSVPGVRARMVQAPVSHLSLVPTILDLLEVDTGDQTDASEGPSLVPQMVGAKATGSHVFAEVHTKRMVVKGSMKLIWDTWRRTVELYDLQSDPGEKKDLSDRRRSQLAALKSLIRDYIHRLGQRSSDVPDALAAARLGGRQAAAGLCRLLGMRNARWVHRAEAARRLGRMPGSCAAAALRQALGDDDERISAEAAIAMGELKLKDGAPALVGVLSGTMDPMVRHRAAVAAGRLGLRQAAPYLVAALSAPDSRIRYRASHYLGEVGGPESVEALIRLFSDEKSAHLVCVSLGQVGARHRSVSGRRVVSFLVNELRRERRTHVVRAILRALGFLADAAALPDLLRLAARPDLPEAREALIRCAGLDKVVYGVDFSPESAGSFRGAISCRRGKNPLDFSFLGLTTCLLSRQVTAEVRIPESPKDRTIWLRMKALSGTGRSGGASPFVRFAVNGQTLGRFRTGWGWSELKVKASARLWVTGRNEIRLETGGGAQEAIADYLVIF